MPFLFVVFFVTSSAIFAFVVFLIRPSADQVAVNRRIAAVKAPEGSLGGEAENLQRYLKTLQRGSFGFLEEFIEETALQKNLSQLIVQADRTTSVGTVLFTCLGLGVSSLTMVYLMTGRLIAVTIAAAVGGFFPVVLLRLQRNRRVAKFNAALPDCIDMMARSMRAGHATMAALNIVAMEAPEPARYEFNEVCKKSNYGLPMRDALMQLLDRVPSQDLRVLVTGMLVQKDTGGNLVEILDRILFVVRERVRIAGEIKTHTAQGRMTGWILCLLPVVMLLLINLINPGYSNVLFQDPLGRKLLYTGVGLLSLGGVMIRKIVNGIEV